MRIATHVLDGTYGRSAVGVRASLERSSGNGWAVIRIAETNDEGRIEKWDNCHLERGLYRLVFDSDSYFSTLGTNTAYPEVVVIFRMPDESSSFQVHVTLSPYSYSTYCGAIRNESADPR
jgi:5-hydroxyisourate hydrolase